MIVDLDKDPEFLAGLRAFESKHGAVKRKRTTGVKARPVEESASAELGRRLAEALAGADLVAEHVFHPDVSLDHGVCPWCRCERPERITNGMQKRGAWNRGWRFDWAFPSVRVAIEVQGQGRHQRYVGYRGDCEKLNSAVIHGWRCLWFVAAERKHMADWVAQVIAALSGAPPA